MKNTYWLLKHVNGKECYEEAGWADGERESRVKFETREEAWLKRSTFLTPYRANWKVVKVTPVSKKQTTNNVNCPVLNVNTRSDGSFPEPTTPWDLFAAAALTKMGPNAAAETADEIVRLRAYRKL